MEPKKRVSTSFVIDQRLLNLLDKGTLERLHSKNRSDFLQKAIHFCLANEELFIRAVVRSELFEKEMRKAFMDKDGEKVTRLFLIDAFNIDDFGKPIQ